MRNNTEGARGNRDVISLFGIPGGSAGADGGIDAQEAAGSRRPGSDEAMERLRAKILSGELPPGTVVSQVQLASDLGISITPLREMIRQLQAEGLLEIEPNRRPRVAPLSIEELHATYAGRILLESFGAAMTVPLMSADDLQGLADDLADMRARADTDPAGLAVAHDRFHRRLFAEVPAAIASALNNFYDRAGRYRRLAAEPGQMRSWVHADSEHERILECARARDGRAASVELGHHLARTALHLSALLDPGIDPRAVRTAVGMLATTPAAEPIPASRRRARS